MNEILFFIIFIIPAVIGFSVIIQWLKEKIRKPVCLAERLTLVRIEGEEALTQLKFELMRQGHFNDSIFVIIGEVSENTEIKCVRLLKERGIDYMTERKGKYGEL